MDRETIVGEWSVLAIPDRDRPKKGNPPGTPVPPEVSVEPAQGNLSRRKERKGRTTSPGMSHACTR